MWACWWSARFFMLKLRRHSLRSWLHITSKTRNTSARRSCWNGFLLTISHFRQATELFLKVLVHQSLLWRFASGVTSQNLYHGGLLHFLRQRDIPCSFIHFISQVSFSNIVLPYFISILIFSNCRKILVRCGSPTSFPRMHWLTACDYPSKLDKIPNL